MTRATSCQVLGLLLSVVGCSSAAAESNQAGTISGGIQGSSWTKLSNAYWIGKPSRGSAPVILFLFESQVACTALVNPNWDKAGISDSSSLEVDLLDAELRLHTVGADVAVAYLKGFYNPDADSGTVTLSELNDAQSIKGSFDLGFGGDALHGTFTAQYCADGVEP